jgi:hypothetical protein
MGDLNGQRATKELADFIQGWSDVYSFTFERAMWHARRRDNGAVVHVATPEDLAEQVVADFLAKPVRIGARRS